MIKGGYTYLDFSVVTAPETPVTIPGTYQKIKDTFGKPTFIKVAGLWTWGMAQESDGDYVFECIIVSQGLSTPIVCSITDEDAVQFIIPEGE